ncbi:alanine racemase [Nocardia shimofusensis]|uniref:alanine racemase n=1 Tax=Nocardia shimofusensis TaxID=228596 RepID=UPI000AF6FD19|nr:alanine racemase [Nocardia shimofusensis]
MGLETAVDLAATEDMVLFEVTEDMVLFEVDPAQRVAPPPDTHDDPPAPAPEPEPLPDMTEPLPIPGWPMPASTPQPTDAPVGESAGSAAEEVAHPVDTPVAEPQAADAPDSGEVGVPGTSAEGVVAQGEAAITAAPMPAYLDPWEERVLADPDLLGDIAFAVGTPFHLMYPARVRRNIAEFQRAFDRAGVDGVVYYGKKANKAACVARACAEQGAGVDVSSVGELTAALAQGVRGEELMVTGPAKSAELLWLAARHGALIAIDALDELDRLLNSGPAARILLRALPDGSSSRFGMTGEELDRAVERLAGDTAVRLTGFSFHLSGYDAAARAVFAAELVDRCVRARELGHDITTLSIGGGFGVDYLPADAWSQFTAQAAPTRFHAGKSFASYYPYHFPVPGAAMLTAILTHHGPAHGDLAHGNPAHGDLAKALRDNDIRLAVEPGRALLAHAGSTVFGVRGAKTRHAHGSPYRLLTVDGTSLSLSEQWFDSEYLPDPLLWPPRRDGRETPTSVGASSCLESDMVSWRRIPLPRPAEPGDLLVYPNTAGYQMDSNESAFHELPLPPKVVLHETDGDRLRWALDAR